ncbi:MurR/RpiR family transcriptional regulator [Evansella halocellulosilytica]|uniref:MurR/RpiR family transcriptional regulator n=1 Tax=Evansella halocellulosilytica TaxID=2011013 RepID=UPI000BB75442|nr:MurR/RpiR family transcriptional regulator [Evansella halocellulosilytica]
MSILERIQIKYHSFSPGETKVADFVLNNKEGILNIHIKDLASATGVSVATITRFCKRIDCKSFVDFKILLRDAVELLGEAENLIEEVDTIYHSIIRSSHKLLEQEKLEVASNWIQEAKSIQVYGLGSSGLSATELKYRLMRMGYTVDAHTDSHLMLMNAALISEGDLVIAISNSGKTREMIEAVELAKRDNAKVLTITNFEKTPLSNLSDLILFSSNLKQYEQRDFINSQLSILYILDLISMVLLQEDRAMENRKQTLHALNEFNKIGDQS